MKIAVVSTKVPFVRGGAEELLGALVRELRMRGHDADGIELPFKWQPAPRILEHMLAARLTSLLGTDRVIGLKFPAYYIRHDDKILWLLHQFRQAYDLWGTELQDLPANPVGKSVRKAIIAADNRLIPEAKRVYAISPVTRERLWRFNGIGSELLAPPLINPDSYRVGEPADYVLCLGRINRGKRQHLLVEAMAHVPSPVRLVIAGQPENAAYQTLIVRRVSELGLEGRVEVIARWLTHEEKVELLERALAVTCVSVDEDYGYVALEALHVERPVITCSDSGSVPSFVDDARTGRVVDPEPEAIGEAIAAAASDREAARRMGRAGRELLESLGLSWDHVVERLTA